MDRYGDEIKVETELVLSDGILVKFVRYLVRCNAIKLEPSTSIDLKAAIATQGWIERPFRSKKIFETIGISIMKHVTLGTNNEDVVCIEFFMLPYLFDKLKTEDILLYGATGQ